MTSVYKISLLCNFVWLMYDMSHVHRSIISHLVYCCFICRPWSLVIFSCFICSATQLVLQAHKEAVNSLGESGPAKLGAVATVVAVANATAIEATKEVEAAMKISLRAALGSTTNKLTKGQLDDLTIMMVRSSICYLYIWVSELIFSNSAVNARDADVQNTVFQKLANGLSYSCWNHLCTMRRYTTLYRWFFFAEIA